MKYLLNFLLLFTVMGTLAQPPKSRSQLVDQATIIRTATTPNSNTAERVGKMFVDIINNTENINKTSIATGTDDYIITSSPAVSQYVSGQTFIVRFTNPNTGPSTLNINGAGVKAILDGDGNALVLGSIKSNQPLHLEYNGTAFRMIGGSGSGGGGGGSTYAGASPTTVSVGGLASGSAILGSSYDAILESILVPYVSPVFTSFNISGQSATVEVGTTLSGSKTFTWAITLNSGVVSTINIYDNTATTTLATNTPNDGSQSATITTLQLNSNGATQSWKGIGNNSSPSGTFNSSNFVVTSRYYRFFGASSTSPTTSANVRALPSSTFHTGASTFTLATGTTAIKFVVALPPSVTISSVIDTGNLNADITSEFILTGTINVLDAGSTNRSYNIYEYNIGTPYPVSSNLSITTAN